MEARFRARARTAALAVAVAAVATTGAAATPAMADQGPKLLSPGNGKVLARGSRPTFKARDTGNRFNGRVWLTISQWKRRDRDGRLVMRIGKDAGTFTSMNRRKGNVYTYTPPAYTFDRWFMQRPGVYYWQAYHINCQTGRDSCNWYSKIRKFRVR